MHVFKQTLNCCLEPVTKSHYTECRITNRSWNWILYDWFFTGMPIIFHWINYLLSGFFQDSLFGDHDWFHSFQVHLIYFPVQYVLEWQVRHRLFDQNVSIYQWKICMSAKHPVRIKLNDQSSSLKTVRWQRLKRFRSNLRIIFQNDEISKISWKYIIEGYIRKW